MNKKILTTALLLTAALSVAACGKEAETPTDLPTESPPVQSQSTETETPDSTEEDFQSAEGTEDSAGAASQPAEEAEEEASVSYIFSDIPIAAYEVTGLGVGRFESFYNENYVDKNGDDYDIFHFVRVTPGENTFILFCMQGDEDTDYSVSTATIHSPSGSGQWEAVTYTYLDALIDPVPEGFSILTRRDAEDYYTYGYGEETYGGSFYSLVDPWLAWIRFAEIYHPDAPQEDAIYAIDVITFSYEEDYDENNEVLARMVDAFEYLGATLNEIPVEEALERSNIMVSESGTN